MISVPGHTSDSNAFLIGDALFPGDSLFMPDGGTARCDFPGADAGTLFRSIQRLYSLPDSTRLYLAHDYPPDGEEAVALATIAAQKSSNIHIRSDTTEADFVDLREKRDATLPVPKLLWPSLQVNIRGGRLPPPETGDQSFLKIPLDSAGFSP